MSRLAVYLTFVVVACSGESGSDGGPGSGGAPGFGGASASAGEGGRLPSMEAGAGGTSAGVSGGGDTSSEGGAVTEVPQGGAQAGGADEGGAAGDGAQGGEGGQAPSFDASAQIYDAERLPRFDIELSPDAVTALNALTGPTDPHASDYVHATLRYGDELLADVGLRIKGESSFRKLDKKSAFKIKFDEFVPHQLFHGLHRLTLNNMIEDPSFIAERLAYDVYRAAKLPAPRCNSALVYVNGDFYGVYANIESEDKTFLSRWFASNDGNLFEEGNHDFLPGAESYFDLETNEAANDRSGLNELIAAASASDATNFSATVGASLNLEHFLRFTAAEAAVNQWDMYAFTMFYPNNFRIYENPSDGRFVFLPWGMDMSMKPFRDSGRAYIHAFEISRQGDRPNGKIEAGILYRKCLDEPACRAAYAVEVEQMANLYEQLGLADAAARYYAQVRDYVYAESRKEYTNERFEQAYQSVLTTIAGRAAALRADL